MQAAPTPGFKLYDTLANKTFLGFLIAEFLAAFNDQCIHASAMFFAISSGAMSPDKAISLMPILFYAPWALFCTLSGYFADKFSKRSSLIFWKVAEVGITSMALLGFWIGSTMDFAGANYVGAFIVLSCVFLMGTHSAFYVPNKYGVLPEIFEPQLLSKANGFVESTSFLAVILGTATGGILSYLWKDHEYKIGLFLVCSALIGTLTSFLIRRMPPSDPQRPFPGWAPWKLYAPLIQNLRAVRKSRPLTLALLGIAFFTFMVAFMRATMYMHGESQNPPWEEFKISLVVAVVALGIGMGSPLAGFLSGGKVELGLVPLGSLGIIVFTLIASLFVHLHITVGLIASLVCIGFFSGFYIVPLYTLMQHRAPKGSKGATVATSNFINVTGAIMASVAFWGLVSIVHVLGVAQSVPSQDVAVGRLAERKPERNLSVHSFAVDKDNDGKVDFRRSVDGQAPPAEGDERLPDMFGAETEHQLGIHFQAGIKVGDQVAVSKYTIRSKSTGKELDYYRVRRAGTPLPKEYDDQDVPVYLFAGASLLTLIVLLLLCRQLPDFFVRSFLWLRSIGRYHTKVVGAKHLPTFGAAILVTNCRRFQDAMHVLSCTDRSVCVLLSEVDKDDASTPLLRFLAKLTGLVELKPGATPAQVQAAGEAGKLAIQQGHMVALSAEGAPEFEQLYDQIHQGQDVPVVPVYCGILPAKLPSEAGKAPLRVRVVVGEPMGAQATMEDAQRALNQLGSWFKELDPSMTLAQATVRLPKGATSSPTTTAAAPPEGPSPK